jgi:hypothetical protein
LTNALCIAPLQAPFIARSTTILHFNIAVMGARLSSPAAPSTLNVKDQPAPSHSSHESNVDVRLLDTSSPIIITIITIIIIISSSSLCIVPPSHFPAAPRRGFLAGCTCLTIPNIPTITPNPFSPFQFSFPHCPFFTAFPRSFAQSSATATVKLKSITVPHPPPSHCMRAAALPHARSQACFCENF